MIEPQVAAVRPRAISPITGATLPLEDLVADLVQQNACRPIQILGGAGAGKTTALRHLRAVIDRYPGLAERSFLFLDEPITKQEILRHPRQVQVVFAATDPLPEKEDWHTLQLARWQEDELLEFLLARHKARCAAILTAIRQSGTAASLHGIPELWTLTLDFLAGQATLLPPLLALRAALLGKLATPHLRDQAGCYCTARLLQDFKDPDAIQAVTHMRANEPELFRLLRHEPVHGVLAGESMAEALAKGEKCALLQKRLPREFIELVAELIRDSRKAVVHLYRILRHPGDKDRQPMAASLCHRLNRQWLRTFRDVSDTALPVLTGAYLDQANWPQLPLDGVRMNDADLTGANLAGASLHGAAVWNCNFHRAVLTDANLRQAMAWSANFVQADLRDAKAVAANFKDASFRNARLDGVTFYQAEMQHADFTAASLVKASFHDASLYQAIFTDADCTGADFTGAKLDGTEFRSAQLDSTRWYKAHLARCNFEETTIAKADFTGANLQRALLTDSCMPGVNFTQADLRDAGLAGIAWEHAWLCQADLRGASFHLGSTRSGLVGSPIALEGSMTGFYTDEFLEQEFKAPEEIRKANLRGADLRGALIDGVDFYLVDLREAKYDEAQAAHFRACGAILHNRGAKS